MCPQCVWPWVALAVGVLIGGIKAKYIFNRSCRKNLKRIDELIDPRVWQFFAPWFFVALLFMIAAAAVLFQNAHNNYALLIGVGVLDVALAVALLVSSHVFWMDKGLKR